MRMAMICGLFLSGAILAQTPEPSEAELRERALKLNKEANNEEAADARLKELNKDKVTTPKLVKAAAKVLKEAKEGEKPFRFYAALVLAKAAHNAKEFDAAEQFYQFCTDNAIKDLQSSKLISLAMISQINFYLGRKQYDQAIKACDRYLKLEDEALQSQALTILEKKFQALARKGDDATALTELEALLKRSRGNILLILMKAGILREAGKLDECITVYKDALEKVNADANLSEANKRFLATSIRYSLSGVFTEQGKIDDAAIELEKLMEMNPDAPTFRNDLGFIWADNDKNLDKAEKLIREAIEMDLKSRKKAAEEGKLDPEAAKKANPAYVDSLGWVLYKKKQYEEALKYLLESANNDEESDHIEIWDHVGDCYLALNKKQKALEAFQRGLKSDDLTKKDAERRRKVTEKVNRLKRELK